MTTPGLAESGREADGHSVGEVAAVRPQRDVRVVQVDDGVNVLWAASADALLKWVWKQGVTDVANPTTLS
jgi:hypothetical protein